MNSYLPCILTDTGYFQAQPNAFQIEERISYKKKLKSALPPNFSFNEKEE